MTKMLTTLLLAGATLAAAPSIGAKTTPVTASDFSAKVQTLQTPPAWGGAMKNTSSIKNRRAAQKVVETPDTKLEPSSIYGTLYGPDDTSWYYTAEFTTGDTGYTHASYKIYNNLGELFATLDDDFTLGENETSVNQAEINPTITKKFFNSDDNYEVMIFIHATTTDYMGHTYNDVFTINNGVGKKFMTIEGNEVLCENTSTSSWSENYVMIFERDDYNNDRIYFDAYTRKTWSSDGPELKHTFECDVNLISAMADGLPIILTQHDGNVFYATANYEIPYFDPEIPIWEDAVVQTGNNLVITLYNSNFDVVNTMKVPVPEETGDYIYVFPVIGVLNSCDDVVFDKFSTGDEPAYVITFQNYTTTDDYVNSYYVYNSAGERINTVFEDAYASLYMSDVTGQPDQFCFYCESEDDATFSFVDFPSCEEVAVLPIYQDNMILSTSLDRAPYKDSYRYAISQSQGEEDSEGNVVHKIHWYNADGSYAKTDAISLGTDVAMAQVYISGKALTPYLFNTDDEMEYMFLVKRYIGSGSTTEEHLVVYNELSEVLLEFAPTEDGALSNIMLMNLDTNPQLLVTYVDDDYNTTMSFTSLPLSSFDAGGSGTEADPYLVNTVGDFMQISAHPSAYYKLINDLDFSEVNWSGFGANTVFSGYIDGNNRALLNLRIDGNGIFDEMIEKSEIKDLIIDRPTLSNPTSYAGFLVGQTYGTGTATAPTFSNIHVLHPTATGDCSFFGGLVGQTATYTSISDCSVENANINMPNTQVGGIAGNIRTSTSITNCFVSGDIVGGTYVGGIAGSTSTGDETVSNCHVNANITGESSVGGVVGYSKRTPIENNVVEGTLTANNAKDPAVGGVAGTLVGSTSKTGPIVMSHNIVALSAINAPAEASTKSAHRIVGHSSAEDSEIDWENTEFDWDNFDWSDTSLLPRIPGDPELFLDENYAVSPAALTDVATGLTSIEGADLALSDVNEEFLAAQGFAVGETSDAPWQLAELPYLYFENQEYMLYISDNLLSLVEGDTATLIFTLIGGDINNLTVESSREDVVKIVDTNVSGSTLEVNIELVSEGTATITGSTATLSQKCVVISSSGVKVVEAAANNAILYNGSTVTALGSQITLYNVSGMKVAAGNNTLNVTDLAKGVYVVAAQNGTVRNVSKIIVK